VSSCSRATKRSWKLNCCTRRTSTWATFCSTVVPSSHALRQWVVVIPGVEEFQKNPKCPKCNLPPAVQNWGETSHMWLIVEVEWSFLNTAFNVMFSPFVDFLCPFIDDIYLFFGAFLLIFLFFILMVKWSSSIAFSITVLVWLPALFLMSLYLALC